MTTVYDVAQLLKKYGIILYLGKRQWDMEMMEYELTELFKHKILDREVYARARSILKVEIDKEKAKNNVVD